MELTTEYQLIGQGSITTIASSGAKGRLRVYGKIVSRDEETLITKINIQLRYVQTAGSVSSTGNVSQLTLNGVSKGNKSYNMNTWGTSSGEKTAGTWSDMAITHDDNGEANAVTVYGKTEVLNKVWVNSGTLTFSLPAYEVGKVNIKVGDEWKKATPYVYDSGEWKQAKPYTYDSSEWKLCK